MSRPPRTTAAVTLSSPETTSSTRAAGPQIRTGGNVAMTAGGDIGAQEELQMQGGGEGGRPISSGP